MKIPWDLIILANITGIVIGFVYFDAGHQKGYKQGYTQGYQDRINYEHGNKGELNAYIPQ